MSAWTNEQVSLLQKSLSLSSAERYRLYVKRFGETRSFDAIERQARRVRTAQTILTNVISAESEDDEIEDSAPPKPSNPGLRKHLGRTARSDSVIKTTNREDFDTFVERLIDESGDITVVQRDNPSTGSSFLILLSDTHIGKYTNNFNKDVFIERLLSIPEKMQDEISLPEDLEEIVICLVGDMLEGENIYETQAHHIELAAIDQVQIATDTFWKLALSLQKTFNVPVRIETCPGNHGRVSRLAAEKTNWDNIIYQTLGYIGNIYDDPNLTVNVNFDEFHTFPVQDKTGLIFHHGTKHLGTPAMQNKVAGWLHTKHFDFMMHGHWHHWEVGTQFGKLVVKNGSLPGDDDLSERMGVFDPPRQGWLVIRNGQPINVMGFFEWHNGETNGS